MNIAYNRLDLALICTIKFNGPYMSINKLLTMQYLTYIPLSKEQTYKYNVL